MTTPTLAERIDAVFDHAGQFTPWRYVPRAIQPYGSGHWNAWDRKEQRFVTDDELAGLSLDQLAETFHD